jgi:hypothetical protein
MFHFCTYFDVHYLPRALCLLESLEQHAGDFRLFMLCLDEESYSHISKLGSHRVIPVSIFELEQADRELASVRPDRSRIEYYYTSGPSFIRYLMTTHPEADILTHIDADTFFFSDPAPLMDEMAGASIGLMEHRALRHPPEGRFNVGWLSFRRDRNGLESVNWWRERCIEWCYERFEDGKYADQKYLDDWPVRFAGVKVIKNKGANLAPWNVRERKVGIEDSRVAVDGTPLIFFHFHGFKQITPWLFNTNLALTFRFPSRILIQNIYGPYIRCLKRNSIGKSPTKSVRRKRIRHPVIQGVRNVLRTLIGVVFRQYVIVFKDHVF